MKRFLLLLSLAALLGGCATGTVVTQSDDKITAERIISLDAPSAPWVAQIEARLRQQGFRVKRISRNSRDAFDGRERYVLTLDGSYYTGWEYRCFGGGYKFEYITAELIDLQANESVVTISGEGYSEGCPPAAGTIFGDIARAVADKWR